MASGERRLGSGRRGMTVLGKIPTPSVPKPINLPSQRLENRGLEPNVELVPRGTFSWGSAGRSNAVSVNKGGGSGIESSPPTSSVAWNGALKMQDVSTLSADAGSLADSNRPLSAGGTRPSSAPTAGITRVWGSSAKTRVDAQKPTSGLTVNPVEPVTSGPQESADVTPRPTNVILNRPTSADGTVMDRDVNIHPGVNVHASAGTCPASVSEGFQHPGDGYNGQKNQHHVVWQGMPPVGGHELPAGPVGPGPYSGPLPHELYYSPFGAPQYGSVKDRDMVVVRMVNGPGVYGNFPPHLRPAECFGPPGTYGSYRPSTKHAEQFAMSGNSAMGAISCTPGMNIGFFPDGNKYLFPGDGQFGTVPRDGGYPDLQREANSIPNVSSVSTHGTEWNQRMPRPFGRHNHASGEHGSYTKDGLASFAMPAPEKKITLLTKTPRVEAVSNETIMNNSALLLDSNQGNEGGQLKTVMPKIETENVSTGFEVKGVEETDKSLESKKLDGGFPKMNTSDTAICASEIKQDAVVVSGTKDNQSEVEAGLSKAIPQRSSKTWRKAAGRNEIDGLSSSQKSFTSTNIQDSEPKAQINHHLKSDVDSHGCKISRQAHEGTHLSGILENVGPGSDAVCIEPYKPTVEETISCRDDQKTKLKSLNYKSEKEWRPKSPVVEYKAPGLRVSKKGKRNEQVCNAESIKEVSSQECNTASNVLEASSLLPTQKADKRRALRHAESLSASVSSGINSDKEAPFVRSEDSKGAQSRVLEVAVDPIEIEQTSVLEASCGSVHNTASSADQALNADTTKGMATEGLILKGNHKAKPRQFNYKGEKEWRPKSPAIDSTTTADNVSGSQASEVAVTSSSVSDVDIKSNDLKFSEPEGLQPLDAYDYDGQRAKLREIAAQRAKQRQKEEEERIKEQKAKALAKLDELNRRTLVSPTGPEMIEHGSVVCMDEVPSKKLKKKLNSSRRSSVNVPVHDSGDLEKQHIDEEMVSTPVKDSKSVSAITTFHKKYPAELWEDSKEVPSNDVRVSQNSRNKRDEPEGNSLKTAEKCLLHSTFQEQRRPARRERLIHEEELPSAVHDTEVQSSSSKNFGAEDDTRFHGGLRQTESSQNQTGKIPLRDITERKGIIEERQKFVQPNSSSVLSQLADPQDMCGMSSKAASRWAQESSVEGQKQMKAGELSVSEEHPFAIDSLERKTSINSVAGQQSARNSRLGQKHRSERDGYFVAEQAQSVGFKQPIESIVTSDVSFGSEKPGRSHVSWRQKSSNQLPNSDKVMNDLRMESGLEESVDKPIQSQKSRQVKNAGGREYISNRRQRGQIQLEVRDENRTDGSGSSISEMVDADISKHDVEAKVSEGVRIGRSQNSRRHKNITNGSYISKGVSMKELNERCPESLAATEALEETVDPTHLHAASTSNLHNPVAHTKQSPRASVGASQWHKHRSMKLANASLSPGQAGEVPLEERLPGRVVSASRHRSRPNVDSMQGWETEQFQESESLPFGHSSKGGSQFQAQPALPLEANVQNHSARVIENFSDQHLPFSSSKNRSNHTSGENRKMNRHYQAGPQAFKPRGQQHEAELEIGNNRGEQRASQGRDKPSRKSQFNGCSTAAELNRRGAEPAIKTEISY